MVIALLILIALQLCVIIVMMRRRMPAILEALGDIREAQLAIRGRQYELRRRVQGIPAKQERSKIDQPFRDGSSAQGRQTQGLSLVRKGGSV